jgi:hypothetical protein
MDDSCKMKRRAEWSRRCATAIPTTIRREDDDQMPTAPPPATLGDVRAHGVRRLLVYCTSGLYCYHSAVVDADRWPDDTVLRDLDKRAVCTRCGMIGADVRPDWMQRPRSESLTGAQWR